MLPGGGGGGLRPPQPYLSAGSRRWRSPPVPHSSPGASAGWGAASPPAGDTLPAPTSTCCDTRTWGTRGGGGVRGSLGPPPPSPPPPLNPSTHPQLRPQQDLAAGTPPGQREPAVQCQPLGGQELGQGQAEGTQGLPPLLLHLRGTGGSAPRDGTPTAGTGPLPWGQDPRCEDGAETCSSSDSTWGRLMRKEKPSSHTGSADGVQVWGYKSG